MITPPRLVKLLASNAALAAAATLAVLGQAPLAAATPETGLSSLPAADEATVERYRELVSEANDAYSNDRHARAARLYRRALEIDAGNEGSWYNLACIEALRGQTGAAIEALERAAEAGWDDPAWPQRDTDLESIHETVAFRDWVASFEARSDAASLGWPTFDESELARSEEEIEEVVDERGERLNALRGFIGSRAAENARRELAAWRAASWASIARAESDADARASAWMEAASALAGRDVRRIGGDEAAELLDLLEAADWDEADRETITQARYLEAHARHRLATDGDAEAAQRGLEHDLLVIAATGEGPAVEKALGRLVGLHADRPGTAERLVDHLVETAGEEEARSLVIAEDRGTWFRLRGLPEFEATTLDGRRLTRSDLTGAVTLLDFWATWCGPCRAELPELKRAVAEFGDRGFRVIGISLDDAEDKDAEAFEAWCDENGVTWTQVYDGGGWQAELAREFGVRSIPFPLLLDRDGNVIAADGEVRGENLVERVRRALDADEARSAGAVGQ